MESLLFTLNAVLPIIICIVVGYILKLLKLFPDSFWGTLNKLCFRVLLPMLLFKNIYDIKNISDVVDYWKILLYCASAIIIIFFIGLIIVKLTIPEDRQKGVVLQCVFRSNYAIIGIGLIELLAGGNETAKGIGAIISAISIPLFNILAIISLSLFIKDEEGNRPSAKEVTIKILKNPLIIAVFTGLVFLAIKSLIINLNDFKYVNEILVDNTGEKVSVFLEYHGVNFIYTTIKWLAQCASPIALIALGGAFQFSAVARLKKQIIIGTSLRIVIIPTLTLIVAYFMGFNNINYFPALIALFATPVAVSSVPMASEMKNDSELAGQLVVWCSILSAITLFVIIFICAQIGIF